MLVCSISQRAARVAITAGVVEAAAALDAPGTGNVVFATLVDDPASVGDLVDAYLGEIMLEAASASDTVSAGSEYAAAVLEETTATDLASGSVGAVAVARSAMLPSAFVNSDGTLREANAAGVMVNQ